MTPDVLAVVAWKFDFLYPLFRAVIYGDILSLLERVRAVTFALFGVTKWFVIF